MHVASSSGHCLNARIDPRRQLYRRLEPIRANETPLRQRKPHECVVDAEAQTAREREARCFAAELLCAELLRVTVIRIRRLLEPQSSGVERAPFPRTTRQS